MALRQPNVLPGFGLYSHALRATSTGIAQSREARQCSGAKRGGDRS